MAGEDASKAERADTNDDDVGSDRLLDLYRGYIGQPESQQDVYIGFGLFFAGIALGVVGLTTFLYSGTLATGSETFWQFREIALVTAVLGLPAVALSIVVLLPVGQKTLVTGLLGAGICLAATVWLTTVYPFEWTEAGNDVSVISTYAVGIVVLAASTGSALVAEYVNRTASSRPSSQLDSLQEASTSDEQTVTDDEVEQDIEEVMEDSSLTWGGVDQQPTTKRLELDMPETDEEIDQSQFEKLSATETRAAGDDVNNAVDGLRQLQGSDTETARAESPDKQVTALTEFRNKRDEELQTGVDTDESLITRVREKLLWNRD